MKKLPIGIQTFSKLREGNFYYVDKTQFIYKLFDNESNYYFLSRPCRFGKSLFLSTLKSAFKAQKEYFKGLYLENNWNWNKKYPILHISFGSGVTGGKEELQIKLKELINSWRREYSINNLENTSIEGQFFEIIQILHEKYNEKIVILIDEYDKPILDMINKPDLAIEVRNELKNFYSVIKDSDEVSDSKDSPEILPKPMKSQYLKFVFLTGVTKFSKLSLFSGLNNLEDITLHKDYGDICGYTQNDIETVFSERLY